MQGAGETALTTYGKRSVSIDNVPVGFLEAHRDNNA